MQFEVTLGLTATKSNSCCEIKRQEAMHDLCDRKMPTGDNFMWKESSSPVGNVCFFVVPARIRYSPLLQETGD